MCVKLRQSPGTAMVSAVGGSAGALGKGGSVPVRESEGGSSGVGPDSGAEVSTGGAGASPSGGVVSSGSGMGESAGALATAMSTVFLAQQLPPLSKFDGSAGPGGDKETIKE